MLERTGKSASDYSRNIALPSWRVNFNYRTLIGDFLCRTLIKTFLCQKIYHCSLDNGECLLLDLKVIDTFFIVSERSLEPERTSVT